MRTARSAAPVRGPRPSGRARDAAPLRRHRVRHRSRNRVPTAPGSRSASARAASASTAASRGGGGGDVGGADEERLVDLRGGGQLPPPRPAASPTRAAGRGGRSGRPRGRARRSRHAGPTRGRGQAASRSVRAGGRRDHARRRAEPCGVAPRDATRATSASAAATNARGRHVLASRLARNPSRHVSRPISTAVVMPSHRRRRRMGEARRPAFGWSGGLAAAGPVSARAPLHATARPSTMRSRRSAEVAKTIRVKRSRPGP